MRHLSHGTREDGGALDVLLSATQALRALPPRTVLDVPTVYVVLMKARQSGAQTPSESESDAGAAHPQSPQVPDHTVRGVAGR